METYKTIDVDAPEWTGPFLRPCFVGKGSSESQYPADDLTRAAMSGGGGWIYVLKGRFLVREDHQSTWIGPGQAFLFTSPTHATLMYPEPVTRLRVGFYGEESAEILERLIQAYGSFHRIPSTAAVVRKTEELFQLGQRRSLRTAHLWSVQLYEWLMHLCRALEKKTAMVKPEHRIRRNSRLVGVIHPSFKSYADAMGYDPSYLARSMKKSWGNKSPAKLLRRARLQQAEKLLRTTNMTVRVISKKVCYSSPESFATAFRQIYGFSPLKYRHHSRLGWLS